MNKRLLQAVFCVLLVAPRFAHSQPTNVLIGYGVEPSIITNRTGGGVSHVTISWMGVGDQLNEIWTRPSFNSGASWLATAYLDGSNELIAYDPTMAVATSPVCGTNFYFGWLDTVDSVGLLHNIQTKESPDGQDLSNPISSLLALPLTKIDRPWLLGADDRVYASWAFKEAGYQYLKFKRGVLCFNPAIINWSVYQESSYASVEISPLGLVSNPAIARGPGDYAYGLALQHDLTDPLSGDNMLSVYLSSDGGQTWTVQGDVLEYLGDPNPLGWDPAREAQMANFHIVGESDDDNVYAFYVTNVYAGINQAHALYCRTSNDNGDTWNVRVRVSDFPAPPSQGYAEVPKSGGGNEDGYYRIGRVWSCVDDFGNVHVVWFDNRLGLSNYTDPERDYWQVFHSQSSDNGQTWSAPELISEVPSVGGFALPHFRSGDWWWTPPGDFLACDADSQYLYISWPDSRAWYPPFGIDRQPIIYFARVPLS